MSKLTAKISIELHINITCRKKKKEVWWFTNIQYLPDHPPVWKESPRFFIVYVYICDIKQGHAVCKITLIHQFRVLVNSLMFGKQE